MKWAAPFDLIPGFIEIFDKEIEKGMHYIRANSICSIRPHFDHFGEWKYTMVRTDDQREHAVNATVEQIADAIALLKQPPVPPAEICEPA